VLVLFEVTVDVVVVVFVMFESSAKVILATTTIATTAIESSLKNLRKLIY
jgi:hypothetical protein